MMGTWGLVLLVTTVSGTVFSSVFLQILSENDALSLNNVWDLLRFEVIKSPTLLRLIPPIA